MELNSVESNEMVIPKNIKTSFNKAAETVATSPLILSAAVVATAVCLPLSPVLFGGGFLLFAAGVYLKQQSMRRELNSDAEAIFERNRRGFDEMKRALDNNKGSSGPGLKP